jgi:hypothetical protein
MADYFTQFSCQLDVGSADNAVRALTLRNEIQLDLEEADEGCLGFEASIEAHMPSILWIRDDDGFGEPEHVISFVLRCADAFDLHGKWGFAWALTCTKPRLDSFSGGAQAIDLSARKSLGWVDCDHWLAEMLDPSPQPSSAA